MTRVLLCLSLLLACSTDTRATDPGPEALDRAKVEQNLLAEKLAQLANLRGHITRLHQPDHVLEALGMPEDLFAVDPENRSVVRVYPAQFPKFLAKLTIASKGPSTELTIDWLSVELTPRAHQVLVRLAPNERTIQTSEEAQPFKVRQELFRVVLPTRVQVLIDAREGPIRVLILNGYARHALELTAGSVIRSESVLADCYTCPYPLDRMKTYAALSDKKLVDAEDIDSVTIPECDRSGLRLLARWQLNPYSAANHFQEDVFSVLSNLDALDNQLASAADEAARTPLARRRNQVLAGLTIHVLDLGLEATRLASDAVHLKERTKQLNLARRRQREADLIRQTGALTDLIHNIRRESRP